MTDSPPILPILLDEEGRIATLTINRPAQMNCLTREAMSEIEERLNYLQHRGSTSVLIICGAGGIFSAGADLGEVAALDPESALRFSRLGQKILGSISDAAPVTIAAIDGYCLGGGLDIALSCDLRYAAPGSSFQHPGVRRGIITGWGGTQRLPRLIGRDEARRVLLSGDRIEAAEALRIGLINRIEPDVRAFARRFASEIDATSTRSQLFDIRRALDQRQFLR